MSSEKSSAAFSYTMQLKVRNKPGHLAKVVNILGEEQASVAEVNLLSSDFNYRYRTITMHCKSEEHAERVIERIKAIPENTFESVKDDVFVLHEGGKLKVEPKIYIKNRDQLSQAYTPGVARVCNHIAKNPEAVFDYTMRGSTIAVVTDGTAVLGLGNIGPKAGLPVMEGKAVLFKQFGGLNAFPICIDSQDTDKIIETVALLAPNFGGINLEDIAAPRCFEIETALQERLDIPVFHDDQHGTACVVLAGLMNSLKVIGGKMSDLKVVISGVGAGGVAIAKMLNAVGIGNIVPCDSEGIVYKGRKGGMNPMKDEILSFANKENEKGSIKDAMKGANVFIGVSKPGVINVDDVKKMKKDPIVFALANPTPEIMPEEIEGIARIIGTGRSDYQNQINNVLCFPGIFKGAVECRATKITDGMKLAAAQAIASAIPENELSETYIIPDPFNMDVPKLVAERVRHAAIKDGVARLK
jgi:malate dehydrogenase (oxaloacetate-decarboxylating)